MQRFRRLGLFAAAGLGSYLTIDMVFWAYCVIGGHNMTESLYGATATYLLSLVAAIEVAWLGTN